MFLNKLRRLSHTLALRLTVWYAAIFTASSILIFILFYFLITGFIAEHTNQDMEEDLHEFSDLFKAEGMQRIKTEIGLDTKGQEAEKSYFRLWASDGSQIAATDLTAWGGLAGLPVEILEKINVDGPVIETIRLPAREHAMRRMIGAIAPSVVLEIGQSLEDDEELVAIIMRGFLSTLAAVFLLGAPIGWFMARRSLSAIEELTRTADEISRGAFERRMPIGSHGDELDHLAQTFNSMLDRIQALILGMREMTDNLAHDLRSPLGRIRTAAEMSLTELERTTERGLLAINVIEECDRLLDIINTTLDIAEAESGAAQLVISDVDLTDLVIDACDLFQTVAEDRKVSITTDLPAQCLVPGDRQRLQRVFANLLDNALKYTPANGRVRISLIMDDAQVKLRIADTGMGISASELPRIFERFYRCDRSRGQGGNGLGLSLARAIVRTHGGDISVTSTLGENTTFTVTLRRISTLLHHALNDVHSVTPLYEK